jgi:hypothetical protein
MTKHGLSFTFGVLGTFTTNVRHWERMLVVAFFVLSRPLHAVVTETVTTMCPDSYLTTMVVA